MIAVDPYSSGATVVKEIQNRGYDTLIVWTKELPDELKSHLPDDCRSLKFFAEIREAQTLEATAAKIRSLTVGRDLVACFAAGEFGVDLSDALSEYLGLRTNGQREYSRRDKKVQQDLIHKAGLRSVREAVGSKFEEVEDFLRKEEYPVVLKPLESAGSEGVKLCYSFEEAKDHFDVLLGSESFGGAATPQVLCQEFLKGDEYVIDHVSRDGIHKTCMLWKYDKRPTNGSAFVYYGMIPVEAGSPEGQKLIPYTRAVLDAMGIRHGPTHGEVMMTGDGPCLVEMNCRAHGGEASWQPLCHALTGGFSQIESTADALLDEAKFAQIPDQPPTPLLATGREVTLVSFVEGTVKATPGYDTIRKLPSFVSMETSGLGPGSQVVPSIDLITAVGSVILAHNDKSTLERDLEVIRNMERSKEMFILEEDGEQSDSSQQNEYNKFNERTQEAVMILA